ncbi:hypothetical protein B0H14DRAFT_2567497 [Mycena olivaceomarginata]|nr:hypothetical protein B0H14DRAFT_2567497 [Mycena olivaceomarginata]
MELRFKVGVRALSIEWRGPACRYRGYYGAPEGLINVRIGRVRADNGRAGGEREQPARVDQGDVMHGQSAERGVFRAGEVELKGRHGLIYAAIIPENESAGSMSGAGTWHTAGEEQVDCGLAERKFWVDGTETAGE